MSKSDYLENEVLKWVTGQAGALGAGSNGPYVALYTTAPTDAGGGVEVSTGSYARSNSDNKWAVPTAGSVSSNVEIAFVKATAAWGNIIAVGLFDAVTGGNLLHWGTITSMAVGTNETARFAPGALTLTED